MYGLRGLDREHPGVPSAVGADPRGAAQAASKESDWRDGQKVHYPEQPGLADLDKWSRVIPLPVNFEQGPVFEPFARIGLLFTENLDRIRQAYTRAGEMLDLWGDSPAAARLVAARTSKG